MQRLILRRHRHHYFSSNLAIQGMSRGNRKITRIDFAMKGKFGFISRLNTSARDHNAYVISAL
jgi:hypothetical protein